ncbi:ATP-binding protein [Streptomyces alfalfae]|uniref:Serine/threonine protein phosphatase n=1 Tax=Streptomyces alfalfae TaxID=1642299 RepID=A0ABM6GND1_9ACTN|nr:ATP-binding protein [Streptomyces alfalfae]APY85162.1 serine/threonine protein phosphatase [Streptomyces alfalfae]AYA15508.1 ATP-binding protein [Streptomyces fradiae]RXX43827.1 ATP-binding protein [Streptomyces alfalfae]RZM88094.1 ATP-binding protein [Streptomyces alfalfae]
MPQPPTRARPTGHPGYSETLPREPESAATARRLLRAACAVWGLDAWAEDGALIVSELVANAVQHARRESIRVVIDRTEAGRVRVGVVDFSKTRPVRKTPGPEDEGGRVLALVDGLAETWGTDPLPWGKRVWAELRGKEEG